MAASVHGALRRVGGLREVLGWLAGEFPVVFSLAPALAGLAGPDGMSELVRRLSDAGALRVEETALVLGGIVEMRMQAALSGPGWLTSCPRVVRLLRSEGREGALIPVPTPMGLHARQIRRCGPPGVRVAFIGPCRHKRLEASEDPEGPDAVILFSELADCVGLPSSGKAGGFAFGAPPEARLAPLIGGIGGLEEVRRFIRNRAPVGTVELLGCQSGCLAGPRGASAAEMAVRTERLLKFAGLSGALARIRPVVP